MLFPHNNLSKSNLTRSTPEHFGNLLIILNIWCVSKSGCSFPKGVASLASLPLSFPASPLPPSYSKNILALVFFLGQEHAGVYLGALLGFWTCLLTGLTDSYHSFPSATSHSSQPVQPTHTVLARGLIQLEKCSCIKTVLATAHKEVRFSFKKSANCCDSWHTPVQKKGQPGVFSQCTGSGATGLQLWLWSGSLGKWL